ncbi:CHAT domain-containing protein [Bradyrhizobium sp. 155]|uniref:CHAT domain-containing protein n=1 Tax=Bradyrhizobium sp. 155 TaxID=2782629 RepID=UPI0020002D93|nr:CHAT domain-containing protein [Bradyrhizobium sp. 155]UPK10714.1 CHAT domain-containing protein [Bradyrhizobium sp. 155]
MTSKHLRPKWKRRRTPPAKLKWPHPTESTTRANPFEIDLTILLGKTDDNLALKLGFKSDWKDIATEISYVGMRDVYERIVRCARDVLRRERPASELAAVGYGAYVKLFPDQTIRDRVATLLVENDGCRIQVAAGKAHIFPWNFLHVHGEADPDPRWFWGARARIKRTFVNAANVPPPAAMSTKVPTVQIGACSTLAGVIGHEVPHLQRMPPDVAMTKMLPRFVGKDRHKNVVDLRKLMMSESADIIHFACHGEKGGGGVAASFTIDDDLEVRSDLLFAQAGPLSKAPLIFLNACEMAAQALDSEATFTIGFLENGARAVLAPECHVSNERSAAFACVVYDKLLRERKPLVDAVRETTNEMLSDDELTGLMYAIHGQAEAHLL